jgi:lambda family phage portal protein
MAVQNAGRIRPGSVQMKQRADLNGSSPYLAADTNADAMVHFNPPLGPADRETSQGRDRMVGRQRHLVRNNGWAAGAVSKELNGVVGSNFHPLAKPDWAALGLSAEWAAEFKEQCEARWRTHANDPRHLADVTRSQTVPQMFGMGYRSYLVDGEAIGVHSWLTSRSTHSCLRVMDTDLLSTPDGKTEGASLKSGVRIGRLGAARGYYFRQGHPRSTDGDPNNYRWKYLAREKPWGRPIVTHFFDKLRDGQVRGVSRLAPIVEKLKMEDHYARVELQAAVINAVFAAFIKTPMGNDAIDELFGEGGEAGAFGSYQVDRSKFYKDGGDVTLGGARLTQLYSGDEIGVVPTARPAAQFGDFESAVLRNVASGLDISYEQLASDWSQTNYSSARAAMLEIWRGWTARRASFAQGFCQPYYMGWLEEEVNRGTIGLPYDLDHFYSNWSAFSRAKWIGPGKGFVDPVKEVQSSAMKVALGLSTLEDEAAELTGSDYRDNIEQVKREIAAMPDGTLHPMQEGFAKHLGWTPGAQPPSE